MKNKHFCVGVGFGFRKSFVHILCNSILGNGVLEGNRLQVKSTFFFLDENDGWAWDFFSSPRLEDRARYAGQDWIG